MFDAATVRAVSSYLSVWRFHYGERAVRMLLDLLGSRNPGVYRVTPTGHYLPIKIVSFGFSGLPPSLGVHLRTRFGSDRPGESA